MSSSPTPGDPATTDIPTRDTVGADDDGFAVPGETVLSRRRPRARTVVLSAALIVGVLAAGAGFAWLTSQLSESAP